MSLNLRHMITDKDRLDRFSKIVAERGGTWGHTEWLGWAGRYTVTCGNGHTWTPTASGLHRTWCPECWKEKHCHKTPEDRIAARRAASLRCARKDESKKRAKVRYALAKDTQEFKDKTKDSKLLRVFGISLEDFKSMIKNQGGLCLLCGLPLDGLDRDTVVDHCHSTGKVRGILHRRCNSALGFFNDSTEFLHKAIEYLEKTRVK